MVKAMNLASQLKNHVEHSFGVFLHGLTDWHFDSQLPCPPGFEL